MARLGPSSEGLERLRAQLLEAKQKREAARRPVRPTPSETDAPPVARPPGQPEVFVPPSARAKVPAPNVARPTVEETPGESSTDPNRPAPPEAEGLPSIDLGEEAVPPTRLDKQVQRDLGGVEYEPDDEEPISKFQAPSWLISAVVHAVAVLILFLITFASIPSERLVIDGRMDPEVEPEQFDDSPIVNLERDDFSAPLVGPEHDPMPAEDAGVDAPLAEVGAMPAKISGAPGEMGDVLGGALGDAEFFGVRAQGLRFVYIVDCSGSMHGERSLAARAELIESIRGLKPYQKFYVIFFNHEAHPMLDRNNPEPDLVPAKGPHVNKIIDWVNNLPDTGGTDPRAALQIALDRLRPHAIFVLTDGEFNHPQQALEMMRRTNVPGAVFENRRVPVHGIGFKIDSPDFRQFIQENEGTYRYIP